MGAGCLREVAALHSDQFIQVPLPYRIEPPFTLPKLNKQFS